MSDYFFTIEQIVTDEGGNSIKALKPDSNGYYRTPVAVLGTEKTTSGDVYDPKAFLNAMFNEKGIFNRTLRNGNLFGEWGHPKSRDLSRNKTIYEEMISHHISKVFAERKTENGDTLVEALIKPCGPYGEQLREVLEDPHINSALSLRAIARDKILKGGNMMKYLLAIITFDYVFAGGFDKASSRFAVAHESFTKIPLNNFTLEGANANGVRVACEGIDDPELSKLITDNTLEVRVGSQVVGKMRNGQVIESTGRPASLTHKIFRR